MTIGKNAFHKDSSSSCARNISGEVIRWRTSIFMELGLQALRATLSESTVPEEYNFLIIVFLKETAKE
jgi:hypothetical protein